ncbi:glycosyltransferase [Pulveribacter sp.]|uniref:glycosyltransferase n=1 Tax=Pulveribacter sp. TaxID=2678893 RepID=UPI0028A87CD1|nr:glycosyltransferase [Pulveribacter sp.]
MAGGVILYDFLEARGGAERVMLELADALQAQALCYGYRNPRCYPLSELRPFLCHDLGVPWRAPGLRDAATLLAFAGSKARGVAGYDWAVFSGSLAPLAVHHRQGRRNFYYCHTPPRFVYDLRAHYLARLPTLLRPLLHALAQQLRPRYEAALAGMDMVLANSENTRRRLRLYLQREAEVIYPPVDTQRFRWIADGNYFISLARHEDLKRVDRIVQAFACMPSQQLVVASGGSRTGQLRRLAAGAPNVHFTSWQTDAGLARLIGGARASIYIPYDEDFGLSPVESMAAGKPVIGVAEGGLLETVLEGETGLLLSPDPGVDAIVQAVLRMDAARAQGMRSACEARAALFARERFTDRMRALVHGG